MRFPTFKLAQILLPILKLQFPIAVLPLVLVVPFKDVDYAASVGSNIPSKSSSEAISEVALVDMALLVDHDSVSMPLSLIGIPLSNVLMLVLVHPYLWNQFPLN